MPFRSIYNHSAKESHSYNKVWYRSHTEPLFKSNQILKFEDMYTMQISLFVYDLINDLLPKSFRNLLSQTCLTRHGIITRQNNLIPQSRPITIRSHQNCLNTTLLVFGIRLVYSTLYIAHGKKLTGLLLKDYRRTVTLRLTDRR